MSALSLPKELRERWFARFMEEVEGGSDPQEVAKEYIEAIAKRKYNIGFHTSPFDIKPNLETGRWTIKGTEKDHRDGDRVMAYYSKKYNHLYKKDGSKYIYVVRTDPEYQTDQNWSRADSLSVIMRMPLKKVIDFVELVGRNAQTPDA